MAEIENEKPILFYEGDEDRVVIEKGSQMLKMGVEENNWRNFLQCFLRISEKSCTFASKWLFRKWSFR